MEPLDFARDRLREKSFLFRKDFLQRVERGRECSYAYGPQAFHQAGFIDCSDLIEQDQAVLAAVAQRNGAGRLLVVIGAAITVRK